LLCPNGQAGIDYRHFWPLFESLPEAGIAGADSRDLVLRHVLEKCSVTFAGRAIHE
jgi:hypothetical protein